MRGDRADDDDGDRTAIEIYERVYGATSLNISALTPWLTDRSNNNTRRLLIS